MGPATTTGGASKSPLRVIKDPAAGSCGSAEGDDGEGRRRRRAFGPPSGDRGTPVPAVPIPPECRPAGESGRLCGPSERNASRNGGRPANPLPGPGRYGKVNAAAAKPAAATMIASGCRSLVTARAMTPSQTRQIQHADVQRPGRRRRLCLGPSSFVLFRQCQAQPSDEIPHPSELTGGLRSG